MDHKPSDSNRDSWVDDRMANLQPAPQWEPDSDYALDQLNKRRPSASPTWMRLAMTSTILAGTVLVLVLLPWQKIWTSKPVEPSKAAAPLASQPEKATEQPQQARQDVPPPPPPPPPPGGAGPDAAIFSGVIGGPVAGAGVLAPPPPPPPSPLPQGVSEPQVIYQVLPAYTDEARQAKVTGTVELTVTIKVDGTVQFESFKKTLGYGLDEKAREAIEQWKFVPAKKDGVPVATMVSLTMNFSLR